MNEPEIERWISNFFDIPPEAGISKDTLEAIKSIFRKVFLNLHEISRDTNRDPRERLTAALTLVDLLFKLVSDEDEEEPDFYQ